MSAYLDILSAPYNGFCNSNANAGDIVFVPGLATQRFHMSTNSNQMTMTLCNSQVQVQGSISLKDPVTSCNVVLTAQNTNTLGVSVTLPFATASSTGGVITSDVYLNGNSNIVPSSTALSNAYNNLTSILNSIQSPWQGSSNVYTISNVAIGVSNVAGAISNFDLYVNGAINATSYCNYAPFGWAPSGTSIYTPSNVAIGSNMSLSNYALYVNGSVYATTYTNATQWTGKSNLMFTGDSVVVGTSNTATNTAYDLFVAGSIYATAYCNVNSTQWNGSNSGIWYGSNVTVGARTACNYNLFVNGVLCAQSYCNLNVTTQWTGTSNLYFASNVVIGSACNATTANYKLYVNGSVNASYYANFAPSNIVNYSQWNNAGSNSIWYGSNVLIGGRSNTTSSNYMLYVNGPVFAQGYSNVLRNAFDTYTSATDSLTTPTAYLMSNVNQFLAATTTTAGGGVMQGWGTSCVELPPGPFEYGSATALSNYYVPNNFPGYVTGLGYTGFGKYDGWYVINVSSRADDSTVTFPFNKASYATWGSRDYWMSKNNVYDYNTGKYLGNSGTGNQAYGNDPTTNIGGTMIFGEFYGIDFPVSVYVKSMEICFGTSYDVPQSYLICGSYTGGRHNGWNVIHNAMSNNIHQKMNGWPAIPMYTQTVNMNNNPMKIKYNCYRIVYIKPAYNYSTYYWAHWAQLWRWRLFAEEDCQIENVLTPSLSNTPTYYALSNALYFPRTYYVLTLANISTALTATDGFYTIQYSSSSTNLSSFTNTTSLILPIAGVWSIQANLVGPIGSGFFRFSIKIAEYYAGVEQIVLPSDKMTISSTGYFDGTTTAVRFPYWSGNSGTAYTSATIYVTRIA